MFSEVYKDLTNELPQNEQFLSTFTAYMEVTILHRHVSTVARNGQTSLKSLI